MQSRRRETQKYALILFRRFLSIPFSKQPVKVKPPLAVARSLPQDQNLKICLMRQIGQMIIIYFYLRILIFSVHRIDIHSTYIQLGTKVGLNWDSFGTDFGLSRCYNVYAGRLCAFAYN